jgi:hypothetical protein
MRRYRLLPVKSHFPVSGASELPSEEVRLARLMKSFATLQRPARVTVTTAPFSKVHHVLGLVRQASRGTMADFSSYPKHGKEHSLSIRNAHPATDHAAADVGADSWRQKRGARNVVLNHGWPAWPGEGTASPRRQAFAASAILRAVASRMTNGVTEAGGLLRAPVGCSQA